MANEAMDYFEVFPWNKNLETGIALIDEQHKQLVYLLNKLASHLANESTAFELSEIFDELVAYTDYHFKAEEKIWQPYFHTDPRFINHQVTHQSFITNLLKLKDEGKDKPLLKSTHDILKFLTHWLAYHILDSDVRMAKTVQAVDSGLSLEVAKEHADHELSGSMKVLVGTVLNMYDSLSERTLDLMKERNKRKHFEQALQEANVKLEDRVIARTAELAKSENRLRTLIDAAPLPICAFDNNRDIIFINQKFIHLFGYALTEIPTLDDWWLLACPDTEYRNHVTKTWNQTLEIAEAGLEDQDLLEFKIKCKDGNVRDILFSNASAGYDLNLVILQDLTERNEMADALITSQEQFYQAQKNEALGVLVGGIAHDFNNMLASITGNIFLIKHELEDVPEDIAQKLDVIEDTSFHAADMIKQLLTFARKGDVSLKPHSLSALVNDTLKFLHSSIPENIRINKEVHADDLTIYGNATQFHQLLINLVNNACDALEDVEDPNITIRLSKSVPKPSIARRHKLVPNEAFALLTVEDNGCGIPENVCAHIFEPFFSTKEQGRGTGLGLAMVFGAIKNLHGVIDVDSQEGRGTTINIYIPLQQNGSINDSLEEEDKIIHGQGKSILVVDDNEAVRFICRNMLENMSFSVTEAADGQEAVELFSENPKEFDLVILDVVMPKMGGVEAAIRMMDIRPDIKFIFQTGYDKGEALINAPTLSHFSLIQKPYTAYTLSSSLSTQLSL